jgi:signal transduction histidine kinase
MKSNSLAWYKNRRIWLLGLIGVLSALLLWALVWLAGQYEQSKFEDKLELASAEIVSDMRSNFSRNAQRLHVLTLRDTPAWSWTAMQFLEAHPEVVRLELRDNAFKTEISSNTPFAVKTQSQGIFEKLGRQSFQAEVTQACTLAKHSSEPAYSLSYFVPIGDGTGHEVIDMCLPRMENNQITGYLVATYSLELMLKEWIPSNLKHQQEISFVEADGSRLAASGTTNRSGNKFLAQSLLDLQGITLILRIESWHSAPYWLANILTVLVLGLALALGVVLWLLFRDMRKRLQAEEFLRQSLERLQRSARLASLGEMASMLSHELNQPLAAITSYATGSLNLIETVPASEEVNELKTALTRITHQSQRAGQVIKSVNDFVRRRDTERVDITPQALMDTIAPLLGLQAKQMGVRIAQKISPDLPKIQCDKTLIEQVIINLARNGMQAMDHASITLRVLTLAVYQTTDSEVMFSVTDTGMGLSAEVIDKLFTPFFTTKAEGTGLGLSLCRTVIEQHGSNLSYSTRTEGVQRGTTFSFRLKVQPKKSHALTR